MLRKLASALLALLLVGSGAAPAQASNQPGLVPTFGSAESVAGGFAVPISNWDPTFSYTAVGADCSIASVSNGWLTVTGVLSGQTVSARVFTTKAGHDEGTATFAAAAGNQTSAGYLSAAGDNSWISSAKADSSGNLYVAWNEFLGGKVVIKKSSDQGRTWTLLKEWSNTGDAVPTLAISSGGRMAAFWRSGFSGSFALRASVSSDSGLTWSTPTQVAPANDNNRPAIGIAPDGDVVVAWDRYDGTRWRVFTSASQDGGTTFSTPVLRSASAEDALYATFANSSDGNLTLFWEASGSGPRASHYDHVAGTFGAQGSTTATNFVGGSLRVSPGADGKIWATWLAGFAGVRNVAVGSFASGAWTSAPNVTTSTGDYYEAQIIATQNHLSVIWQQGSNAVFGRTSASQATVSWGTSINISGFGTNLQNPRIIASPSGTWVVSYNRTSATAPGNLRPHYVLSTNQGTSWSAPVFYASSNFQNYVGQAVADSTGAIVLLWNEQAPNNRIRAAVITSTLTNSDPRTLYQVAEINPGAAHSTAYDLQILNNKMYLIARHVDTGFELFEFDGTNIRLIQDLWPGTGNGAYDTEFLANTGSALYFAGTNGITGYELYKFDGTAISLAADINPDSTTPGNSTGNLISAASFPRDGAVLGNKLFFNATYPITGASYVLDLGAPNAVPERLSARFSGFNVNTFLSPVVLNSVLYFRAQNGVYRTDAITTPTLVPGTNNLNVFSLGASGSKLLIGAGVNPDVELMIWDPAAPSTPAALLSNINTFNSGSPFGSFPTSFVERCNTTYFVASSGFGDVIANREVWKYDGYEVTLAKDFWPGSLSTNNGWPQGLHVAGNEVFAFAQSPGAGFEPWILRGSEFTMIQDFRPGADSSMSGAPPFVTWNGTTYFRMWGPTGLELYAYGVQPQNHQVATFAMNYTITYDPNGGTGSATATNPAGSVTLNSGAGFTRQGKVLLGWDTSSTATTPTHAVSASYNLTGSVTLYAIWGDEPVVATPGSQTLPAISNPGGVAEGQSGGDLKLQGSGFASVTGASIDEKDAEIKEKSDSSLTLGLPELEPGVHDLTLTTSSGQITLQDAVRIRAGAPFIRPEALAKFAAWTKLNASKDRVRLFAKNPIGVGKVQFLHNGKEIAWIRTVDETDPKLRLALGASYLTRTVSLSPGKNVFQVVVEGKRFVRASYQLSEIKLKR